MKPSWKIVLGSVAAGLLLLGAARSGTCGSDGEADWSRGLGMAGYERVSVCEGQADIEPDRIGSAATEAAGAIFRRADGVRHFDVCDTGVVEFGERVLALGTGGGGREPVPEAGAGSRGNLYHAVGARVPGVPETLLNSGATDPGSSDRWNGSWFEQPRLQFQFIYNRQGSERYVPFAMPSSYTRKDNPFFKDDFVSYSAVPRGLVFPGDARLGRMIDSGLRLGDRLFSPTLYTELSNHIEQEDLLLGYLSSLSDPLNPVVIKTHYRSYDSNAQTDTMTGLIRADHFPYNRRDAAVDAYWEVNGFFSVDVGYRWQRWERDPEYWENASTDEHLPKIVLKASPFQWLNVSASFSQSIRTSSDYRLMKADPELPEQMLLPKFSQADRNRNRFDFTTQLSPSKDLGISLNCGFAMDSYGNSVFNLMDGRSWSAGASGYWAPISRLVFSASLLHEEFNSRQFAGASASAGIYETRDTLDSVGAGLNLVLIPEKLNFIARGSYSISRSDGTAARVGYGCGVLSRFENFLRLQYSPQLSFRCGYLFEGFGTGQGGIAFVDPYSDTELKDYNAHVMVAVVNYEF